MKKIMTIMLAFIMLFAIVGCSNGTDNKDTNKATSLFLTNTNHNKPWLAFYTDGTKYLGDWKEYCDDTVAIEKLVSDEGTPFHPYLRMQLKPKNTQYIITNISFDMEAKKDFQTTLVVSIINKQETSKVVSVKANEKTHISIDCNILIDDIHYVYIESKADETNIATQWKMSNLFIKASK